MRKEYDIIVHLMILVVDGSGGKIGSEIIKKIRNELGRDIEIVALGTNAIATANMIKAGANNGASGENALSQTAKKAEIIIGPANIAMPNSYLGELTPKMALSICNSEAKKLLIPINADKITYIQNTKDPLPHILDKLIEEITEENNVRIRRVRN